MMDQEFIAELLRPGDVIGRDGRDWRVEAVAVTHGTEVLLTAVPDAGPRKARRFTLAPGELVRVRSAR